MLMSEKNHTKLAVNHLGGPQDQASRPEIKESQRADWITVIATDQEIFQK
jgi:hypothetical protein